MAPVASATYAILLPGFALGTSTASLTFNSGSQASLTLTVTPINGFHTAVSFACSGLPAGALCSFTPAEVTPSGGAAVTARLTVANTVQPSTARPGRSPFLPAAGLALPGCVFVFMRRRNFRSWILCIVALAGLSTVSACGRAFVTAGDSGGGIAANSIVTVTASSGSIQQSTQITLTVY